MFGRVVHFQGDPARLDEMVGRIPALREKVNAIRGGVTNWAMWNQDGSGMTVAIYESEAAADAAQEQIQAIWGGLADLLTAPPEIRSFANVAKMRD